MNEKLRSVLATVAPGMATALGGPLAGMVATTLAKKWLGEELPVEQATVRVEEALTRATPADLVQLKEIEAEFAAEMKRLDIELVGIAAQDRNSARQRQSSMRDWTPSALGLAIVIGFFVALGYVFRFGMPDSGTEVLLIMLGALGTMTTQVGNYFFGSSVGSKTKEDIIAQLKGGAR